MWNWINCYLSGRHDYGVWCEPGAVFLRCVHCGKRSSGWNMDARPLEAVRPASAKVTPHAIQPMRVSHVLRFERPAS